MGRYHSMLSQCELLSWHHRFPKFHSLLHLAGSPTQWLACAAHLFLFTWPSSRNRIAYFLPPPPPAASHSQAALQESLPRLLVVVASCRRRWSREVGTHDVTQQSHEKEKMSSLRAGWWVREVNCGATWPGTRWFVPISTHLCARGYIFL